MSTMGSRRRGAGPVAAVATATALALLAMPVPATGSPGAQRTALLTLTGSSSLSELAEDVAALGGQVLETLDLSDSLIVQLPASAAIPAGAAEVPDVPMTVNSAGAVTGDPDPAFEPTYLDTIGAASGTSTGDGVTIALVDTGVDTRVGWLGSPPTRHSVVEDPESDDLGGDGYGHGTFLAGILKGTAENPGVAPGAELLDIKVADSEGTTSLSNVLKGLEAADEAGADVVNLALSTDNPLPPSFDPLTLALDRLWISGVTVVVSAGNSGPKANSVGSPGNDPLLLTVGAVDENGTPGRDDDSVADFSSRGTKYATVKPDLVAPGVSIVSTAALGSAAHESAVANGAAQGQYMRGSGTSMATAVVSGAVAAVREANDALSPDEIKSLLASTAFTSPSLEVRDGAGAGELDLSAAIASADEPISVGPVKPGKGDDHWGPSEDDAEAWAEFAAAWESGDEAAVKDAWAKLSWQTKQWAARSWSFAVLVASVDLPAEEFDARSWHARSWSLDEWLARSWSARSWSARSWSFEEWLARSWSARSWSARSWSARSWSVDEWLDRAWEARSWSTADWAARSWSARSWSARSWSARSWSDRVWSARSWSGLVWEARSWSARSWSARSWSARSWSARSWSSAA